MARGWTASARAFKRKEQRLPHLIRSAMARPASRRLSRRRRCGKPWVASAEQRSQRAGGVGDSSARLRRYRANLQAELDRAVVYRAMADAERHPEVARSSTARRGREGSRRVLARAARGDGLEGEHRRGRASARGCWPAWRRGSAAGWSSRPLRRWRWPSRRRTSISRRRAGRRSPPRSASMRAFSTLRWRRPPLDLRRVPSPACSAVAAG